MPKVAVMRQKDYNVTMSWRPVYGTFLLITLILGASGCKLVKKKSPNLPPQAQAPPIMVQPAPTQPGPPPPATVEPSRPMPTPGEVATNTSQESAEAKPKHVARKPAPRPKMTVVDNGPPPNPAPAQPPAQQQQGQLTASVSHNDALHQKVDTQQLIDTTEGTLRGLNRSLSDDEQAMVAHIRSYIQQSKNATTDGDLERAYNLALKAHLLSDELVKK